MRDSHVLDIGPAEACVRLFTCGPAQEQHHQYLQDEGRLKSNIRAHFLCSGEGGRGEMGSEQADGNHLTQPTSPVVSVRVVMASTAETQGLMSPGGQSHQT